MIQLQRWDVWSISVYIVQFILMPGRYETSRRHIFQRLRRRLPQGLAEFFSADFRLTHKIRPNSAAAGSSCDTLWLYCSRLRNGGTLKFVRFFWTVMYIYKRRTRWATLRVSHCVYDCNSGYYAIQDNSRLLISVSLNRVVVSVSRRSRDVPTMAPFNMTHPVYWLLYVKVNGQWHYGSVNLDDWA